VKNIYLKTKSSFEKLCSILCTQIEQNKKSILVNLKMLFFFSRIEFCSYFIMTPAIFTTV